MEARIARELFGARATDDRRELALDLTASEVVLHEGSAGRGWRRFAGVALDDPEFLEVMALLREEAEGAVGRGRPAVLWLPAEQVLRLSARIEERDPKARLRAAFDRASRETGQPAEELAVALAPGDPAGEATLLVTYAATWREARDYAARWGFVPGPVSTRHHAEEFGPAGPEFRVQGSGEATPLPEAGEGASRHLAWLAVGVTAVISLAAATTASARAPGGAPVPEARAAATVASDAVSGRTGGPEAAIPPPRPEWRGVSNEGAGMLPPPPDAAAAEAPNAGRGGAAEPVAGPGGLASPHPAQRPERVPAPTASRAARSGPASPGFLPPARPAGMTPALRLDRVALIGVLNFESGRQALLRLPDGEFVTVRSGEVLDGWEVAAIGPEAMQVRRGAETLTLLLVSD